MILAPTLLLNAGSGAAIARPTFSRDFAGEKTLNNGTGPAITFTRASGATYFDANGVLQTAANDAPRFDHDPVTGASRGLLIEEQRANLLVRSAELDNASWLKGDATVSANATTAPDGTTSAELVIPTTSNVATHRVTQVGDSVAAGATVTASVYFKAGGYNFAILRCGNALETAAFQVGVNLSNGTISTSAAAYGTGAAVDSANITSAGNGWYRVDVTGAVSALTSYGMFVYVYNASGAASFAGDGTSGLYIWGAQLEAGAFPTSYIPTTSAAATRAADSAVVTPISSFYNQVEGTLFSESRIYADATSIVTVQFDTNTGTISDNRIFLGAEVSSSATLAASRVNGTAEFDVIANLAAGVHKVSAAFAPNNFAVSLNGGNVTTDSEGTLPTGVSHMRLGSVGPSAFNTCHIRKLAYWPKRLSNTLLEQLTT
jgi:hypothetical protein